MKKNRWIEWIEIDDQWIMDRNRRIWRIEIDQIDRLQGWNRWIWIDRNRWIRKDEIDGYEWIEIDGWQWIEIDKYAWMEIDVYE